MPRVNQVEVVVDRPKLNISSTHTPATQQRHTSLSWRGKLGPWLLSVHLQSAMQIAAGIFVACLFTFVRWAVMSDRKRTCLKVHLYVIWHFHPLQSIMRQMNC